MPQVDTQQLIIVIAGIAGFGLVLSLWIIGVSIWAARQRHQARQREQRLGLRDMGIEDTRMLRLWHDGTQSTTLVPVLGEARTLPQKLDQLRAEAGFEKPVATILLGLGGMLSLLGLILLLWTGSIIAVIGGVVAVLLLFWTYVRRCITRRQRTFDQQLVDALELAARSLRAGHPLSGAFHLIAEEIPSPVGPLFAEICQQEALGVHHEEAITRVAEAAHNEDMRLFATAVKIQLRSGGNLADLMERLTAVIRDRMRLNRRVRVLTAQTQLSKNILMALPFVLFAALSIMNPGYMQTLYETAQGRMLMLVAAGGLMVGAWMMNRMAVLKY